MAFTQLSFFKVFLSAVSVHLKNVCEHLKPSLIAADLRIDFCEKSANFVLISDLCRQEYYLVDEANHSCVKLQILVVVVKKIIVD